MGDFYEKWWSRLKFTLWFLVITVIVRSLFGWFHGWLQPPDPYKVPEGRAAKVFHSGEGDDPDAAPGDRLRLFFWYGE
jgi:hypothetical protein